MQSSPLLVAALVLAGAAAAQAPTPGQSLVTGSGAVLGLWLVDHETRTVTKQTLTPAIAGTNCITMLTDKLGYIGTVGNPADVYEITYAPTATDKRNWKTRKLNTTASAGQNCSQIVRVGANLYFATQTNTVLGTLNMMSISGGPVTKALDTTTVGALGLANAVAAIGTDVYIATFNSGTTTPVGEIVKYDTVANKGSLLMQLPKSKQVNATSTSNVGPVNAHAFGKLLAIAGVFGDLLIVDPATKKVVYHEGTQRYTNATVRGSNLVNSFAWNPVAGDWLVGSRDAHLERWAQMGDLKDPTTSAERIVNVGTGGSINGYAHFPDTATGTDFSTGHGCGGNGGYTLTAANLGSPTAGSPFAFAAFSGQGGDSAVLLIAAAAGTTPLAGIGMTPTYNTMPACFARFNAGTLLISLPVTLNGTLAGQGWAMVKAGLPQNSGGTTLHSQWAELQKTKTNRLGVVASNGRETKIK